MKIYVKNKIITIREGSKVFDENGDPAFIVKGAIFSIFRTKTILDLDGKVLYKVKNKWLNFFKKTAFICNEHGKRIIKIKEKNITINKGYTITGTDDDYEIEWGGWLKGINRVLKNGEEFAVISRKLGFNDVFEVDFDKIEDAPFLVALTIAIDNIVDMNFAD